MFDMHKSIAWFALCSICASLNDQPHCQDSCDTVLVRASLGSSILLPCHAPFLNRTDWRLWVQNTGAPLVNLSSQGKVWFLEPRQGRVKTFPNEGSRGNFTIRIDGLQESDLGCYQCGPADACHQVVVQEEVDLRLPLFLTAGGTTVILFVCFCCCYACSRHKGCSLSQRGTHKRQENGEQDYADIGLSEDEHLASNLDQGPPATIHDYEEHQSESFAPCRAVRGHPQLARTRSTERKHAQLNREIFSRLRQASRHFHVNQDEIIQKTSSAQKDRPPRAGLRGKKVKQRYENPIYNTPSQVDHL